jgi:hypothetical protein
MISSALVSNSSEHSSLQNTFHRGLSPPGPFISQSPPGLIPPAPPAISMGTSMSDNQTSDLLASLRENSQKHIIPPTDSNQLRNEPAFSGNQYASNGNRGSSPTSTMTTNSSRSSSESGSSFASPHFEYGHNFHLSHHTHQHRQHHQNSHFQPQGMGHLNMMNSYGQSTSFTHNRQQQQHQHNHQKFQHHNQLGEKAELLQALSTINIHTGSSPHYSNNAATFPTSLQSHNSSASNLEITHLLLGENSRYAPGVKLFIGDLSYFCTESDLVQLFLPFGPINHVHIRRGNRKNTLMHGFIILDSEEMAHKSVDAINGKEFMGRHIQ